MTRLERVASLSGVAGWLPASDGQGETAASGSGQRRRESHRHVLYPVEEIGPEPAGLAVELDVRHPLGERGEQHPELERGQVPAQAEVRPAAAEPDVRVRVAADVEPLRVLEHALVAGGRGVEDHALVAR